MIPHPAPKDLRRLSRALAVTPAVAALVVATPALAAPPEQWAEADPVSPLGFLLVLLLVPAGLFLVISLLAALPSMGKGTGGYHPGQAWRHEAEWFGGPRDAVSKSEQAQAEIESGDERGGSSARW